jgi:DNA-directed RNA polymerase specialized sigma24 family protein
MKGFKTNRKRQQDQYATATDFQTIFSENRQDLYQLSLVVTGDPGKAQECFVASLEDSVRSNYVFRDWAGSWAKRAIIKNAIRTVQPSPGGESARTVGSWVAKPAVLLGHLRIHKVVDLMDFERFVFVMSVLEKYSEHECAVLLGCSIREIRNALNRAVDQLTDRLHGATSRNTSPERGGHQAPWQQMLNCQQEERL